MLIYLDISKVLYSQLGLLAMCSISGPAHTAWLRFEMACVEFFHVSIRKIRIVISQLVASFSSPSNEVKCLVPLYGSVLRPRNQALSPEIQFRVLAGSFTWKKVRHVIL